MAPWKRSSGRSALRAITTSPSPAAPCAGGNSALALEAYERACAATRFRSRPVSRAASITELLGAYRGPVLFLFGEHDVTTTPEAVATRLAESAALRSVQVIPNAGHWVQYERPDAVATALLDFLA